MAWTRGSSIVVAVSAFASLASAQPRERPAPPPVPPRPNLPAVVGGHEITRFTAPAGFIDDAIAFDDKRIAYVIADGSSKAELHVAPLAPAVAPAAGSGSAADPVATDAVIDLAAVTTHPIALELVGQRAFVIGIVDDATQIGALIELAPVSKTKPAGTVVYKLTGTHVQLIKRDGKTRIAVDRQSAGKTGTRHQVELDAIETGKRIAAGAIEVDSNNTSHEQDFHVNNWFDGYTRAMGIKGGSWDKKENQRTPDVEATYDVLAQKIIDKQPIGDLFEQRKRYQSLADANGQLDFVKLAWDNQSVQLWRAGKSKPLELDQPLASYDPKSLQGSVGTDVAWLALKVDATNPDAVARKKADPEYFDVFRAGSDGKAVRKLRVLATGTRHRFGVMKDALWVLERSPGFDRGGKTLSIYKLD